MCQVSDGNNLSQSVTLSAERTTNPPAHRHSGRALIVYLEMISLRLALILTGNITLVARSEFGEAGIRYSTFGVQRSTQSVGSPANHCTDPLSGDGRWKKLI